MNVECLYFLNGELDKTRVCAKFAHTVNDGKTYNTEFYNLDAMHI